jgi:hypothetical protein
MAGFTWDDVQQAKDAQAASDVRGGPRATYEVPQREWKDPGRIGAIREGVGQFSRNLSDGLVQALAAARGDEAVLRGMQALRKPEDAYFKQTEQQYPFMTGAGQALPYALVPGGPLAGAMGAAAVEGLSYGSPAERAKNAALGGGMAYVGGKAGEKVGGMVRGMAGPGNIPTREAVAAADRLGMPLTVGQRTGIEGIQRVEDMLARAPGSSGVMANNAAAQQRAVNQAIGGAIGATDEAGRPATRLTQDVVARARGAAVAERQALKGAASLDASAPGVAQALNNASAKLANLTDNLQQKAIRTIEQNDAVKDAVLGIVNKRTYSGEQYQGLRTALKNAQDAAFKADDTAVANFYKTLRSGLDDIAQQGQKEAWKASDIKFATLKLLEDTTHVWNPATGDVSAKNFANRFSQVYGTAAKEGRIPGAANDVLLAGKGLRTYPEGSQTAGRQMFNSVIDAVTMGPPRYVQSKVLTSPTVARLAEKPARMLSAGMWPSSPGLQDASALLARQGTRGAVAGGLLGLEGPYLTTSGLLGGQ